MKKILSLVLRAIVFLGFCTVAIHFISWPNEEQAVGFADGAVGILRQLLPALIVLLGGWLMSCFFEGGVSARPNLLRPPLPMPLTRHFVRDILLGFIFGLLLIGGILGLLVVVCDAVVPGPLQQVPSFYAWMVAMLLNAVSQEYLIRGYLFSMLLKRAGEVAALTVSTLLFTVLYGGALAGGTIAIFVAFAFGLLLSLVRLYTGGMLAPVLIHFLWNLGGILLFGLLPGAGDFPCLWDTSLVGLPLFTGGDMKIGASLISLLVIVALIDLLMIIIEDSRTGEGDAATGEEKPQSPRR